MTLLYGRFRVPWIKAACSSSLISAVTQTFLELSWFMWKLNTALLVSKARESSWRQVADIRIKDRLLRSAGVYWVTRCPRSVGGHSPASLPSSWVVIKSWITWYKSEILSSLQEGSWCGWKTLRRPLVGLRVRTFQVERITWDHGKQVIALDKGLLGTFVPNNGLSPINTAGMRTDLNRPWLVEMGRPSINSPLRQ